MFCVKTSSKVIAKYMLLSLLCSGFVSLAPTESVYGLDDRNTYGEDVAEDIYKEYGNEEDILRLDFFRFTTRKRYIWEDWTVPTRDYGDHGGGSSSSDFTLYVIAPILVAGFIFVFVYLCIRGLRNEDCCTSGPDPHEPITRDLFTTVHRPPHRRSDLTAQVHRPPPPRNEYWGLRSELLDEPPRPSLLRDMDSNPSEATISFINSTSASSSLGINAHDNTMREKPPDYSTVTISDLVNPAKPDFPVVRNTKETPPPEYGKDNPFF